MFDAMVAQTEIIMAFLRLTVLNSAEEYTRLKRYELNAFLVTALPQHLPHRLLQAKSEMRLGSGE